MTKDAATIVDQAVDWHVRQRDLTDGQWLDFIGWLEASPAHARAYDRVAMEDRALAEVRGAFAPAQPVAARAPARIAAAPRRWRWVGGTAIAAGLAVMLALPTLRTGARPYAVETRPGELRTLRLDDGTMVEMNGGTKLRLDHADPRVASLDSGEAVFRVRHDAARPFTLTSGALIVRDMGTVFDVARSGQRFDLQVAEGMVAFQPGRDEIRLSAGQALSARADLGVVTLARVAPQAVGGWRAGRLSFADAPLASVAAAFERRYGTRLALGADLPGRPFTGMIQLSGSAERDIPHLAALIGAGWRRDGQGWVLSKMGAATP